MARAAAAAFSVYLLPLALNVLLPYEYAYPIDALVTLAALCASAVFCLVLATSFGSGAMNSNAELKQAIPKPWVLAISYASVVLFGAEIAMNPSLRSAGTLLERRDLVSEASVLYLLATVLSGAGHYILLVAWLQRFSLTTLLLSIPWGIYALASLLVGNRQYFFMGVCIIGLAVIFYEKRMRSALKRLALIISVASVVMFALQYARGDATKGRQDLFFMSLFNISLAEGSSILDYYALNTLGTTLYAYYGTQYHFLSFIIKEEMFGGPLLSSTFPLIYRRIGGKFGLPDAEDVRLQRLAENETALGFFPRSWGTMWADMFTEVGWTSLLGYWVLLTVAGAVLARFMSVAHNGAVAMIGILACFSFGINFFVFKESFSYLFLILAIGRLGLLRLSS